jgi:hypothetical protein
MSAVLWWKSARWRLTRWCAVAVLLEGEGVVTVAALKPWEACFLTPFHAPEVRLIGRVQSGQYILQDLRVDRCVFGVRHFQVWQLGLLLRAGERDATAAVGSDAFFERGVVERAAAPHDLLKLARLVRCRLELVLIGLA